MAEQMTQKIRDLHCTAKVIHLSIVSLNLAYHSLELEHSRGDKPNSSIRFSAPSSLPTISNSGHRFTRVHFTMHKVPEKSHTGQAEQNVGLCISLVGMRLLRLLCEEEG